MNLSVNLRGETAVIVFRSQTLEYGSALFLRGFGMPQTPGAVCSGPTSRGDAILDVSINDLLKPFRFCLSTLQDALSLLLTNPSDEIFQGGRLTHL
mmetsp:Transcript_148624/g.211154  ORF Transcript_148624/g.211154 Transcript_148624/m.211154 type:complete len:96 (+) Transcript_148624:145-432(+)